ncbi:hypothetical protein M5E06_17745 [Azospirillum sp. A1-3]|uniref:hypothetical protein n=1 Tax=Azospirillum sp. A1-3 TaxID=185874 RepID=UPI0020776960|nr:hypothetical protein [Azospirillum sp. A1-3]MCM8735979.1 hypothetical protein [Azospirillum sp. A1-3]
MSDLPSLISRLEAAEGPSRELDGMIHAAVTGKEVIYDGGERVDSAFIVGTQEWTARDGSRQATVEGYAPAYTGSIDQALMLAADCGVEMHRRSNYDQDGILCTAYVWPILTDHRDIERDRLRGDGANLALAVCAAALRAKLSEARHD